MALRARTPTRAFGSDGVAPDDETEFALRMPASANNPEMKGARLLFASHAGSNIRAPHCSSLFLPLRAFPFSAPAGVIKTLRRAFELRDKYCNVKYGPVLTPLPMPNAPLPSLGAGVPVRLSASMAATAAATQLFREARVPEMRLDGGLGLPSRQSDLGAAAVAAAAAASGAIAEVGGPHQQVASAAAKLPPPPLVVPASDAADDNQAAAVPSPQNVKFALAGDNLAVPLLATPKTSKPRAASIAPLSPAPMPPKENIEWDPFREEPLPPAAAGCGFAWRKGVVTAWSAGAGASPVASPSVAASVAAAADAAEADAVAAAAAAALASAGGGAVFSFPSLAAYTADLRWLMRDVIADGPTKSFSFRRLQLLEAQFTEHLLNNDFREAEEQKAVAHRDFYNVRKVDNHVHHSACMNQKHMLRFIKHKYDVSGFLLAVFVTLSLQGPKGPCLPFLMCICTEISLFSRIFSLLPHYAMSFFARPPPGFAPRPTWSCCGATARN
jgi:hypothetical protein